MSLLEWAVIVKGNAGEIERRVRAIYELDAADPEFAVAPGHGDWQVVHGTGYGHLGVEIGLAKTLAEESDDVVYAIGFGGDEPYVLAYRRGGALEGVDCDPDQLAEILGCRLPHPDRPEAKDTPLLDMRSVARLEGISTDGARAACQSCYASTPPPTLHFDEVPGGVILYGEHGKIGPSDISITRARPEVTAYRVTQWPQLDLFGVLILRGGKVVAHFGHEAWPYPVNPALDEIKGAREPAAILAALGISMAHFGFRG